MPSSNSKAPPFEFTVEQVREAHIATMRESLDFQDSYFYRKLADRLNALLEADLRELRAVVERVPHGYKDGPNCDWRNDLDRVCGKPHDEGRHIHYGPQEDYPGYHHFVAERVHDDAACPRCALEARIGGAK